MENLADLKSKSPRELWDLASQVINEHASREALVRMENMPVDTQDAVKQQWTQWNFDALPYLALRDAIKTGDVGRMEDLLPTLLMWFEGGGNSKYAVEVMELLQGLRREWPDEIK